MGINYSEGVRREVVVASYADGVSVASVARRFEVTDSSIYYWRKRYGRLIDKSAKNIVAPSDFIPITLCSEQEPIVSLETEQQPTPSSWQITISMGADRRVEIGGAFELPYLIKLLRGVAA